MTTLTPVETKVVKKVIKQALAPQQFVTKEEFSQLTDVLSTLVTAVTELKNRPTTEVQKKEEAEVIKAKSDAAPLNPAWDEKAREIIGEAVDHCEVFLPKNGGQIFTVVIKEEFSNAAKDYLKFYKQDRRSREIGNEGIGGVESWCKLIKANLKRGSKS